MSVAEGVMLKVTEVEVLVTVINGTSPTVAYQSIEYLNVTFEEKQAEGISKV